MYARPFQKLSSVLQKDSSPSSIHTSRHHIKAKQSSWELTENAPNIAVVVGPILLCCHCTTLITVSLTTSMSCDFTHCSKQVAARLICAPDHLTIILMTLLSLVGVAQPEAYSLDLLHAVFSKLWLSKQLALFDMANFSSSQRLVFFTFTRKTPNQISSLWMSRFPPCSFCGSVCTKERLNFNHLIREDGWGTSWKKSKTLWPFRSPTKKKSNLGG